ncbi:hydrolase 1, exosortase A system-associated [Thiorhodococcus mannitoliphagus]|uniref:Hydrolase 1, exosortase A system-associated n=1 Tax=Thiorhodococcus mannitoliphagus TaxID=329406 RepID=A0A6P1DYI5_9GAMM|nr:hydrolase 1, exosortase A system-associated [Thiorhodococcus mannitoliphagus]NEX22540.1 hydrolase 1, exosortase A system-associated [Thiorhodococcus mannitoliphagus]
MTELPLLFQTGGDTLLGILHETGEPKPTKGVLIVVGGPQYRVGSHRQFVLLARFLAARGIPVLRFDYRGMGDASGTQRDFEQIDADVAAALAAFHAAVPSLRGMVLWGLCDAASAALLTAWRQPTVKGLILLNPWVRTEQGLARAYLKHYYLRRLIDRDFWKNVFGGRVNPLASLRSLTRAAAAAISGSKADLAPPTERKESCLAEQSSLTRPTTRPQHDLSPLPIRMAEGWKRFDGPILVILSGDDLTAAEFRDTALKAPTWRGLLAEPRVTLKELPDANHTFSTGVWRDQIAEWTAEWVDRLP